MEKDREIRKIVGAEWLYEFKTLVEGLNHQHSIYKNVYLELFLMGEKSTNEESEKFKDLGDLDDAQKNVFLQELQKARYQITRTYLKYKSLLKKLKLGDDKEIEAGYKIAKDAIINWEDLEAYVISFNDWLLDQIIDELMDKSTDIITQIYAHDTTKQQGEAPPPQP